ncbi:diaminopimelate decarboxylase [Corynebacterium pseudotuberculosis]|uniref:Diaminopimelate decarboxylase n=1 Tax=Corynebacterium pseudotuberculosis 258 TaxID=1168865 RepID=A0AAU8PXD2_CORPS|nr:diaminopimelate decarboxylase [Corynebacterium pseudotuberculosis]AER68894.1 Diaminopimelate decarboxylase [Corynebacterium pseudotuberculosis 1/06-A]AEQ06388.1 diaminopimelate decarboxylase [Corynebacterium pseudotuberculosis CIP 52.97]AFB72171.2 diaminopimelate decarboxylase [Corynebacterium pseudotuberculosis 316]AFH90658.1 diaminopimelate decarboxylase [Corynebacterium pseudotuberculosis 31]AFK16473.1 diaminopimelate decarboxylase [Corynebacterium pseudotuberculosis 258]
MESFNALPPHVWPRGARREANGEVTVAGVSLSEMAERYGTPVFVVDEDDFRDRCKDMAAAFGGAEKVHYASKAFLTRRIARWVEEEGLNLDIASLGEFQVALSANFPPGRITAHGNNKSEEFLRVLVSHRVGHIVIDSMTELERLEKIAAEAGVTQPVMVRVKPGIEAHTHEFIATSHEDQKFGFSLASGSAYAAAKRVIESASLYLIGLHCHVGSQVFDAQGFSLAAQRVLTLYSKIHSELGIDLEQLDLGGGYGIAYTEDETPLDVTSVAQDLLAAVDDVARTLGIDAPEVLVEPGRAIAGPSTVTVYSVGTVKDVHVTDKQLRRYIAVDGGMSDNIRPALYEAEYDVRVINRNVAGDLVPSRIVGSHCEAGDILIHDRELPSGIIEGDLIALAATGAYCFAMSSRYNMMGRPAVVSVKAGQSRVMVRRETIEDLLALDEG